MAQQTITLDAKRYRDIMRTLTGLSSFEREAIISKAIQEGLSIIVKQGKQNLNSSGVKVRKGNLSKSFTTRVIKKDLRGHAGFKRPQGAAAHLIDRGTAVRKTTKGYNRGKVTANYFWKRAVESRSQEAVNTLMDSIQKTLETIINRNNQ